MEAPQQRARAAPPAPAALGRVAKDNCEKSSPRASETWQPTRVTVQRRLSRKASWLFLEGLKSRSPVGTSGPGRRSPQGRNSCSTQPVDRLSLIGGNAPLRNSNGRR